MPSPFPGMDPFIERDSWEDFHTRLNVVMGDLLNERLPDRYVAKTETRVTIADPFEDEPLRNRVPDVFVTEASDSWAKRSDGETATAVATPLLTEFAQPEEAAQHFLTIRDTKSRTVLTVIETLSPDNKRGGQGPTQYETKRQEVLQPDASLVEIDLLRGGRRLRTVRPLPATEYVVFISRAWRRPDVDAYPIPLLMRLPVIAIPLTEDEPPVPLDLQAAVNAVYDRGRYSVDLNYEKPLAPPLPEAALELLS